MEHMRFETKDIANENYAKLIELFPDAITETVNENGEVVRAIDKDILMQEINCRVVEGKEERYQFTWPDKKKSVLLANAPSTNTLRPCKEESVNFDTTKNLYIEGDNLEVLKLLKETYLHKIKMIYIDPPYNTGNDFLYKDDFSTDNEEYKNLSGDFDKQGNRLIKNQDSNGRFHTDWLNMMYPRLKFAKDLLTDDGVIFISIDDNEVENLKKIGNEVFGESNFLGCAGRITKKANNQGDYWAPNFDYLLTYSKNRLFCPPFLGGLNASSYNLIEEDGPRKGERYQLVRLYMTSLDPMRGCNNQRYYIECPDGSFIIPPGDNYPTEVKDGANIPPKSGKDKVWRWSYQSYLQKKDQIVLKQCKSSNVVGKNGEKTTWNAFTKTYLKDVIEKSSATPNSFIEDHINQKASHELNALNIPFSFAKPSSLMKYLAELCRIGDEDIVLDFFSGSASTADSVLQLQKEKNINCHFILVQLPEDCDEDSDAYKAGFKNICEIGKERIRRVGKKIKEEANLNVQNLDLGFRVLKLDSSNMKDVYYTPHRTEQGQLPGLVDNVKPERTHIDLLFQVMLEYGINLSSKIECKKIDGKDIYYVEDSFLIACFDKAVNDKVVTEIAKAKPQYACLRDMDSDATLTNFEQIFKAISPNTECKII